MLANPYSHKSCNPFHIDQEVAQKLRLQALYARPAPIIVDSRDIEEYVGQNDIPSINMDLFRRVRTLRLSQWEEVAIRRSLWLRYGVLRCIIKEKAKRQIEDNQPPETSYVRVDCYGKSTQTPCVLEIWPGGHYSPMHEHSESSGIVFGVCGHVDVMVYQGLDWNADKLGLVSVDRGIAAWLNKEWFQVHKVFCPLPQDQFAATFHVYTEFQNDYFREVRENNPHDVFSWLVHSDITWSDLVVALGQETPRSQAQANAQS
jgi:hypothetical protein